jgi:chloramphenicol-sensitive protein RarD
MSVSSGPVNTGVIHSVAASMLFAVMPAYLQWLPPLHGYVVVGQRILWTSILIALVVFFQGQLKSALQPLTELKNWPGLMVGALLVGVQWGLFVWAPLQGETLGLAVGYFLLPLVLVLIGFFLHNEHLSNAQWAASAVAALAVVYSLLNTGRFSWVALVVAFGYPLYFILRRKQPIPILSAFFIENLLLVPLAWWACIYFDEVNHPFAYEPRTLLLFLGVGVLGSLGMLAMLSASRRLPVTLFGLLGYLEPPLIFAVGVIAVGEQILPGEQKTYLLICAAIALLAIDGAIKVQKSRRRYL